MAAADRAGVVTAVFHEDWFGEASQRALASLYDKVRSLDGEIIEVGCWEGRSTVALANACHPERVWAIDTWKGSPGEISAELAKERNVFAIFKANIAELTQGNVTSWIGGWRGFFHGYQGRIKFVHIDAEHTYTEVFDNIAAARRHMVPGGIICGDDVHHPPVQQAVIDQFGNANVEATLWWTQC